jgi:hypothetical protein
LMMNPVEESFQVQVNHPLVAFSQMALRLRNSRMTAYSGAT